MSRLTPPNATLIAIGSVVLFCYWGTRKQTALVLLLECFGAAWLIALIAWCRLPVFRPLDFRPVRFYGQISYSFYLLHVLGIVVAYRLLSTFGLSFSGLPASVATLGVTALSVVVTTPAAYFSWRFIEKPFINFGRRQTSESVSFVSGLPEESRGK